MHTLSQNKKIAISAIALFLVSFSSMLFFLENHEGELDSGHVNILEASNHEDLAAEDDPEAIYRSYLGDQESPIFVVDAEGKIGYASKGSCNLLQVDCESFIGTLFFDYINTKDLPELVSAHTKLIQEPSLTEGLGPYRMLQEDKEILVLLSAFPLFDEEGKVEQIVFGMKDLSEQVEELNEEEEATEKKDKHWLDDLYPKIKDMKEEQELRMMVDKISYAEK